MNSKRIAEFLLLKPIFTSRNLTSIALVGVFFFIYVMAGGKVTSVPKIEPGANFGGIQPGAASSVLKELEKQPLQGDIAPKQDSIEGRLSGMSKRSEKRGLFDRPSTSRYTEQSTKAARPTAPPAAASPEGAVDELSDIEKRLRNLPTVSSKRGQEG